MDQTFIPPLESPSKMEILEHLKIFIVHLVVGNKTNSEVVLAAYPRFMQEFLTPSSSFIMNQLSRYVVTEENSSSYFQLYLEKMSTSSSATNRYAYSPNWYLLLSSLNSEIEIPILVWNIGTLEYLLKELEKREESLDFARQLR